MNPRDAARLQTQDGQNIPLLGVTLTGELRGLMFEARVEQRFCNAYDQHVEVVYSFPLPWGAALLGVEVLLGDKHLTGTVVEKKQAEARYEEALSEGNAAIMLEKNPDHSYSLNLGNLAPQEHCTVTLRYAQTLSFEQRGLRLLIPTVIAPRYGDPQQDGGLLPHQVPHHSLTVEHPFELTLRLHGALAQARVASPSHLVGVAFSQTAAGPVLTLSLSRRSCLDCAGLISPDTSIGATHLDEEYEQERTKDIQRGVQAAGRADDSCAGLERRRCLPRHEAWRDGRSAMASPGR